MIRYALIAAAAVFAVACNSAPVQTSENTVGGANVVSSAKTPMAKGDDQSFAGLGRQSASRPGRDRRRIELRRPENDDHRAGRLADDS